MTMWALVKDGRPAVVYDHEPKPPFKCGSAVIPYVPPDGEGRVMWSAARGFYRQADQAAARARLDRAVARRHVVLQARAAAIGAGEPTAGIDAERAALDAEIAAALKAGALRS